MREEKHILKALKDIEDFKENNLIKKLNRISTDLEGKGRNDVEQYNSLYDASIIIKKASAQINEMVHAFGILCSLPRILNENEKIISLSLASGASGDGIDLVTNCRIAEFKFSIWQKTNSNDWRRKQVFADLVSLFLNETEKKKELYVNSKDDIIKFLSGKSLCNKILSKSGRLTERLKERCERDCIRCEYVSDIYAIAKVDIIDIEDVL